MLTRLWDSDMKAFCHKPVMLDEVIEGLVLKDGGIYFDGTVGGGGHSFAILSGNKTVRLIATDKDDEAIAAASERLKDFKNRFRIYKSDYKDFTKVFDAENIGLVDGALLDFGVSSHQIDTEERGFSYLKDGAPLDMRMDTQSPLTAEVVVNEYPESQLKRILKEYGEERFAPIIAANIIKSRNKERIRTCGELRAIVENSYPTRLKGAACARQTFQAIRIEVNHELDGLKECVIELARRLKPHGRICILTFHSLEDRIVKQAFKQLNEECVCPKSFPVCVCGKKKELEIITKKPLVASAEEMKINTRSKCAKLRIAEKI